MPKLKNYGPGKIVTVWLPERHFKIWKQIENKSAFVQLALDQAADIMTVEILRKAHEVAQKARDPSPEEIAAFNKMYPLNELTKKRLEQNGSETQREQPEVS